MSWKIPEKLRFTDMRHPLGTPKGVDFGTFRVESPDKLRGTRTTLFMIASPGSPEIPWEHVSVRALKNIGPKQTKNLTPTWDEMCFAKSLFWDEEDLVVQYHPPASQYVNIHPNVLHLYRPHSVEIPLPPIITV